MTLNLSVGSATMISGNFLRALPPQGSMSLFRSPWGRKALLPVASAAEGQKGVKNQFWDCANYAASSESSPWCLAESKRTYRSWIHQQGLGGRSNYSQLLRITSDRSVLLHTRLWGDEVGRVRPVPCWCYVYLNYRGSCVTVLTVELKVLWWTCFEKKDFVISEEQKKYLRLTCN